MKWSAYGVASDCELGSELMTLKRADSCGLSTKFIKACKNRR